MNKALAVVFAASIGFGLAATGSAMAYAPQNQPIQSKAARIANLPPLAFQLFCLQNPNECRASAKSTVHFNASLLNKLDSVNRSVNHYMTPKADGAIDVWTVGATSGDCDDYALNKRHQLMALGIPTSALRMAVVRTSSGEGHAVLVVHTDNGDYVLDNLTNSIKPFARTGLKLVAVSGANPDNWKNS